MAACEVPGLLNDCSPEIEGLPRFNIEAADQTCHKRISRLATASCLHGLDLLELQGNRYQAGGTPVHERTRDTQVMRRFHFVEPRNVAKSSCCYCFDAFGLPYTG